MPSQNGAGAQAPQHSLHRIPEELKGLRQFVTWRYEQDEGDIKPTKVPFDPRSNAHASVDRRDSWVSFNEAVTAFEADPDRWAGIGFVLTANDPYVFIDLDDSNADKAVFDRQNELYNESKSYAEWSPSVKGLHIICKGSVDRGRKRSKIEIYSQLRFMTMTGNVYRDAPILDEDVLIKSWWHAIGDPNRPHTNEVTFLPQLVGDTVVVERMLDAKNGTKVQDHYNGRWQPYHSTWSEADQALLNMIVFYTKNREQIIRIFQQSALGRRKKATRIDYLERSISLAFDMTPPPVTLPTGGNEGFEGASRKGVSDFWPDLQPLPIGLAPVASFRADFLPDAFAGHVMDVAERMQCPPDYVAVAMMATAAATIGNRIVIRPKPKGTWIEAPNMWAMCVGRPGALKTPAISEAMAPIRRFEALARAENERALAVHRRELHAHKLKVGAIEAAFKKGGDPNAPLNLPDEPPKPRMVRRIVTDATYEAVGEIVADNPNGILLHRDELGSLLKHLEREENTQARGFFLEGWNGTGSYTFDRITRGHRHIEAFCISMIGSIQPGKLSGLIARANKGGEGDDGMIQRFGLLVWPDQNAEWRNVDREPDGSALAAANAAFDAVDKVRFDQTNYQYDMGLNRYYLTFDGPAYALFSEWLSRLEHRLRSDELSPSMTSHVAKYRKLVPTLALVNHLFDHKPGLIGADALKRAINYSTYLETHAARAYRAGLRTDATTAHTIVSRIRKGDLTDGFCCCPLKA